MALVVAGATDAVLAFAAATRLAQDAEGWAVWPDVLRELRRGIRNATMHDNNLRAEAGGKKLPSIFPYLATHGFATERVGAQGERSRVKAPGTELRRAQDGNTYRVFGKHFSQLLRFIPACEEITVFCNPCLGEVLKPTFI